MEKHIFSFKGTKLVLAGLSVLTVLQGFTIILQAYFLSETISSLFRGDLFHETKEGLVIFLGAYVSRKLLTIIKQNIAYQFAVNLSGHYRKLLIRKLFQLGPRYVKKEGSGHTITLLIEGTAKYRRYLELLFPKLINAVFIPILILSYVFIQDSRSAIILLVTIPIVIIFMILLGKAAKSKADSQFASYHLLSNHFIDSLRGIETLKYLGASRQHSERIAQVSEQYRKNTMAVLRIAFLSSFALDFFTMLSIATVAVFLGIGLINGTMELQTGLTILILAPEYFLPVREVGADYHATLDGKNAGFEMQNILSMESNLQRQQSLSKWGETSCLSVNDMNVQLSESKTFSLQDISFSISGCKKIGIIGASGSGKSTLIDVLSGFLTPDSGGFQVNDTLLSSLSLQGWNDQLIYIPQHPTLFHDSLLENIRFYHPDATKKEVEAAAQKAGLLELIDSLPRGSATIIGEGGQVVSGGQEQRIALARAFLGERPILLLDEPTAHLDIESEYNLKETMLELFEGKLVFLATHRFRWMQNMDCVLVLKEGRLAEIGTPQQLWENRGTYYELIMQQEEGMV